METRERIDELKREIEEQERFVLEEKEKIKLLRASCEKAAEILCEKSMEAAEEMMNLAFHRISEEQPEHSSSECETAEWVKMEDEFSTLLRGMYIKSESFLEEREFWPHIGCRILVNLGGQLRERQAELKEIENKMLDGTRAQLRKRALQMEEIKERLNRVEQAVLSLESWEKMYLMFMKDMEIRRRSGMDDRFYHMERQDMQGKLNTCIGFCGSIREPVEEGLASFMADEIGRVHHFMEGYGFSYKKENHAPPRLQAFYRDDICLTEELENEILRYSVGILFIEKHLYNIDCAKEKQKRAELELKSLLYEV